MSTNPTNKLVVYLAGKVAGEKWRLTRSLEPECSFIASDAGAFEWDIKDFPHLEAPLRFLCENGRSSDTTTVASNALDGVQAADLLIAYLDTPDSFGSIAEIAWAAAHKMPVHILLRLEPSQRDKSTPHNQAMADAYWFASSMPGVVCYFVYSDEDAVARLREILRHRSMKAYYASEAWKKLRDAVVARDGGRCVLCNSDKNLNVHHRTYERFRSEDPRDLYTLCNSCHKKHHGKKEVR